MFGGLVIYGLFIGLFVGLGYPDAMNDGAASGFLQCNHGYELIEGKCIDIDECKLDEGPELSPRYHVTDAITYGEPDETESFAITYWPSVYETLL